MHGKWINRALLMPATAWFAVMLVLPLVVVVIFSFGERGAAGGYVPAFTFAQYANLPARLHRLQEHAHPGAGGHLGRAPGGLSPGLFPGGPGQSEVANPPAGHGHRAVLDQHPDPHLCLDLHPRRARHPEPSGHDRHRGGAPDQHAGRGPDRHRLRLPAAHGVSDLCQPGEARQAPARGVRRSRRAALAHLPPGHAAAVAGPASRPGACWSSSCSWASS